jgi:hypothetical protein
MLGGSRVVTQVLSSMELVTKPAIGSENNKYIDKSCLF